MRVILPAILATLPALLTLPVRGLAQTTVAGRVSGLDGLPVPGAVVEIVGRAERVIAAHNGDFSIAVTRGVFASSLVTVRASSPGRTATVRLIPLGAGGRRIDLVLGPDAGPGMISTGLAVPTPRALVPFSIGTISSDALADVPATTLLGGLRGRVAGVRVNYASGHPSTAPGITIRGATGFDGSSNPLIILDGAVVRGNLADIPAADIERIEILKGPSAAAIYGSEGAAGVIQVFTRRAAALPANRIHLDLKTEVGFADNTHRYPQNGAHPFEVSTGLGGVVDFVRTSNGARVRKTDGVADNPYPRYFDHHAQVFRSGLVHQTNLSVGGRHRSTGARASLENTHSGGTIAEMSGFERRSFRLNFDQRLGKLADVALSGFRGWSDSDPFIENNIFSPIAGLLLLEPHFDLLEPDANGGRYRARFPDGGLFNPLYTATNPMLKTEKDRFVGGGTARVRPLGWIEASVSHHIDREEGSSLTVSPGSGSGENLFLDRSKTSQASAALNGRSGDFGGVARIGYLYERRERQDSTERLSLGAPGIGAWSSSRFALESRAVYAVGSLTLRDRYVLDAAIRREQRSFSDVEADSRWFYRVAALWRAGEDVRLAKLDDLRFHAAYGTAGPRPPDPDFDQVFVVPPGAPNATLPRSTTIAELEVGADLAGLQGRLGVGYTYSRKTVSHLPELVFLPVLGSPSVQFIDAGNVRSSTHELTVRSTPIRNPGMSWDLSLTADRIRSRITKYDLPAFAAGPGGLFPRIEGGIVGTMYGSRYVRTVAELLDDPDKKSQSGAGQAWDPANFVVNEEGYVVPKAAWRCGEDLRYRDSGLPCATPEHPIFYVTCLDSNCSTRGSRIPIGDINPDFRMGLQSRLRYRQIRAMIVLDWSQGGDVYNLTRQLAVRDGRDPVIDQRGKPELEKKSTRYYAAFANNLQPLSHFVESASYVHLAELALTYTLGTEQLRRVGLGRLSGLSVGLVGRDLLTLSGYSGTDADVLGGRDFLQYPRFRTVTGRFEVAF